MIRSVLTTTWCLLVLSGCEARQPQPATSLPITSGNALRLDVDDTTCRTLEIMVAAEPELRLVLENLGLTPDEVDSHFQHTADARDHACSAGVVSDDFLLSFGASGLPIRQAMARNASGLGLSDEEARVFFFAQLLFELRMLSDQCGGASAETIDFMSGLSGTPPAVGDVFAASCSSSGGSPQSGSGPGLQSCLQRAVNVLVEECSGEIADNPWAEEFGADFDELTSEEQGWVLDLHSALSDRLGELTAFYEAYFASELYSDFRTQGTMAAAMLWELGFTLEAQVLHTQVTSNDPTLVDPEVADIQEEVEDLERYINGTDCPVFGMRQGDSSMQSPHYSVSEVSFRALGEGGVGGPPISVGDLFRECLCDNSTETFGDLPLDCGSSDDAGKRDCTLNPYGPDDFIRPECLVYLEEDNSPWTAEETSPADAVCLVLQCPEGMQSVNNGEGCGCESIGDPGAGYLGTDCAAYLCPSGAVAETIELAYQCRCGSGFGKSFGVDRLFDFAFVNDAVLTLPASWYDPEYSL